MSCKPRCWHHMKFFWGAQTCLASPSPRIRVHVLLLLSLLLPIAQGVVQLHKISSKAMNVKDGDGPAQDLALETRGQST